MSFSFVRASILNVVAMVGSFRRRFKRYLRVLDLRKMRLAEFSQKVTSRKHTFRIDLDEYISVTQ